MRQRFSYLLRLFLLLVGIFLLAKPLFILFNEPKSRNIVPADYLAVLFHGLPLDLATAAYITALPWITVLIGVWLPAHNLRKAHFLYTGILSVLLALIFTADTCLYSFWDFKLDGTVFNYLDHPRGAVRSVTPLYMATVCAAFLLTASTLAFLFRAAAPVRFPVCRRRPAATLLLLLSGGMLFLFIRGGVGRSTANVGMVYYSDKQFLNHSAVNPAFSLIYSLRKTEDFAARCDFFPEEERARLFASMQYDTVSISPLPLLRTPRPNVLIVLMEGCGATFVEAFGGKPCVTPSLNRLAREGVAFSRCYANSFRTDRGTLCTFSGYPSFPDVSVMKLPAKSRTLPSVAASLRRAGYSTEFLYGGDKNFTNMNSYLMSTGYERTYGDDDFPATVRHTHAWGVTDSIVFDRLYDMVSAKKQTGPWHIAFLTLASHEPWTVPYHRIPDDEQANAMAYLDACIGRFMHRLRARPALWENTLVIFLPDHGIHYPAGLTEADIRTCHIPMIWAGGAISEPRTIDLICNQTDLPATLLGQLGLPHGEFRFSRDVTSANYRYPCAIHTWSGGATFVDTTGHTIIDLATLRPLTDGPQPGPERTRRLKAFLQTAYDDLGAR